MSKKIVIIGLLFILALPLAAAADDPMSAKAQLAMERGLAAARNKDWPTARRHFTNAVQGAPQAAEPLFYLGATLQRLGHDIPAIIALRAFLELRPNDKRKPGIMKDVIKLEVAAEGRARRIIQEAMAAVNRIPAGEERSGAIAGVFNTLLLAREHEWALQMARKAPEGMIDLMGHLVKDCGKSSFGFIDWLTNLAEEVAMIESKVWARTYKPRRRIWAMRVMYPNKTRQEKAQIRRQLDEKHISDTRKKLATVLREFSYQALLFRFSRMRCDSREKRLQV
jgi:tetratricopeptide (TPR) repeat protein